jgi:hypothetical protein
MPITKRTQGLDYLYGQLNVAGKPQNSRLARAADAGRVLDRALEDPSQGRRFA